MYMIDDVNIGLYQANCQGFKPIKSPDFPIVNLENESS